MDMENEKKTELKIRECLLKYFGHSEFKSKVKQDAIKTFSSSDDEKDSRSEGSDRKYKLDASKNGNLKLAELDVERNHATSSREKKGNTKSTNRDSSGRRSSKNHEKERKQHHDDQSKDRRKEYNNHRTERHREKKDCDRDKRNSDYDSKRQENHSYGHHEKYRREKHCMTDGHHFREKHRHRRSVSPREKRDYNEKDTIRKPRETAIYMNDSASRKNIDIKEHKNQAQNITPSVSTTLLTPPYNTQTPLKSCEQQHEPDIKLPSYYNPSVINPNKFADQVQKRKLLWANKKNEDTAANKWEGAKFAQDSDGKVASKFMRLMGIKSGSSSIDENHTKIESTPNEHVKQREEMFSSMEQQYEVARQVTHTMRGVGLGFNSQSRPF